jgi:hypothetical protein
MNASAPRLVILAALVALPAAACTEASADCVKAAGAPVAQPRTVGAFTAVASSGAFDVRLTQGAVRAVTVHAPPEIAALIRTRVEGDTLTIDSPGCYSTTQRIRVDIAAPRFDRLAMSGSGDLGATTPLRGPAIDLALSGSGDAVLEVATESASVSIAGSGDATLAGSAPKLAIAVSGSGDVDSRRLAAADASVRLAGSGDVKVRADRTLDARLAGSGDVIYAGSPAVTKQVAGSGKVRPGS